LPIWISKLLRAALATADSDLDRSEPRPRSRAAGSAAPRWWPRGRREKPGKRRLALFAGGLLAAAIAGILVNALLLQRTRHPAPLLGQPAAAQRPAPARESVRPPRAETQPHSALPAPSQAAPREPVDKSPLETPIVPRPRPPAAAHPPAAKPSDAIGAHLEASPRPQKPLASAEPRPAVARQSAAQQSAAPLRSRPAAAIPHRPTPSQPSRKATAAAAQPNPTVAAAQRALVKLGFVLRADGLAGAATRQAIERYERDRGLPARGTLGPELVRRLSAESGIPID
jgi:hypothetical protein